jgi:hypothetical protein
MDRMFEIDITRQSVYPKPDSGRALIERDDGHLGRLNVVGLPETCVRLSSVILDKDIVPVEELLSFVCNAVERV